MAIRFRFRIRELFEAQGIDTGYKVGKALNKPPASAERLLNDANRNAISLDTVNDLCEFFSCTPGDLFVEVKPGQKPARKQGRK
jgi:hypothetical protein